jgi:hypothetical protein
MLALECYNDSLHPIDKRRQCSQMKWLQFQQCRETQGGHQELALPVLMVLLLKLLSRSPWPGGLKSVWSLWSMRSCTALQLYIASIPTGASQSLQANK